MEIRILHLEEGARQAGGLTVVIDVFRAFTTACYLFGSGAERVLCTGEVETAFRLKREDPERILIGERDEQMVKDFQYGNSPSQIEHADLGGRTVVQTTSAGTRGLILATRADEVLTGSFVNAGAVIRYIRRANPGLVSLVCMGYSAKYPVEEDTLCAEYILGKLKGAEPDYDRMAETIRNTSGKRFFMADNQEYAPSTDFYLCLELDRFDFALRSVRVEPDVLELIPLRNED